MSYTRWAGRHAVPEQSEGPSGYKDHLRKKKVSGCPLVGQCRSHEWHPPLCYVMGSRGVGLYTSVSECAILSPALCRNFKSHKSQYSFISRKPYIFRLTATISPTSPPSVLMPTQKPVDLMHFWSICWSTKIYLNCWEAQYNLYYKERQ